MGTGWRRAFCSTISRDGERERESNSTVSDKQSCEQVQNPSPSPSPRSFTKLGFQYGVGGSSNKEDTTSTPPLLRCRTTASVAAVQTSSTNDNNNNSTNSPFGKKLQCVTTPKSAKQSPRTLLGSNPSSPRSPFAILKKSLSFTRNNCGVCLQSVKTGQGMAIYTAECSHSFHFPCIAAHVRKQSSSLVCPVCNSTWKDVPLLAIHKLQKPHPPLEEEEEIKANQPLKPHHQQDHQSGGQQSQSPSLANLKIKPPSKQLDARSYDDDEPLLCPTAGAKFVPIPEENEEEGGTDDDEVVEEFQGFFVNPKVLSTDECFTGKDSRNVEVSLLPDAAIVSTGRTHHTYAVVLKVKAPPPPPPAHHPHPHHSNANSAHFLDPARRAPIDLVTVLDVSGSMSGAKLQMLKRAMRLVISSLGSADRLSVVAFSATPKRVLPLRRMTGQGQAAARSIIDRLVCSQGTSVADALKKATKVLEDRRERNPVASIILLSDGQDEQVQTKNPNRRQGNAHVSSTRFAHVEIPVHSFGFGQKSGFCHEPAEDAFAKCVGGLLSVVVQDLRIHVGLSASSDPAEITAVYSYHGRPAFLGTSSIRLGDLYAEEERELLVELRVPASYGSHHVLSAQCRYKDPATQRLINGVEQALLVPRAQPVRSWTARIEQLRNLFVTTRALAESRRLIEHNELSGAQHLLSSARALLMQSSSGAADDYIRGLEAEMVEIQWRRQYQQQMEQQQQQQQMIQRRRMGEREAGGIMLDENGEPLTPTSAWRAAEKLAKMAMIKKSQNRVSDLHGFENARF